MTDALLLILGMLALSGIVGLIDMGDADEDDPDRAMPDDTEEDPPQSFFLELALEDQDVELTDFDPSRDKLIIVSPSSDVSIDIKGDSAGSTLTIAYGDSKTTVTAAWPEGDVGDSVVFRHMNDDGETFQDYQLTFYNSSEADIGTVPQFSVIGPETSSIIFDTTEGIVRFSDQNPTIRVQGSGHGEVDNINLDEEMAQFENDPAMILFGSANEGSYTLANGSYSFVGRDSEDQILVDDAKAAIHAGGGNDSVMVVDLSAGRSQVIVYGESGKDSISGSAAGDYVDGGRDADFVDGSGGDDYVIGGGGADRVLGGSGQDVVFGASGDLVETESGVVGWDAYADGVEDSLFGGDGEDEIHADQWDVVYGGTGTDRIHVAYRSTSTSTTFVADFDPSEDQVEVVVPADDAIALDLELEPGTYSADFLTWEAAEEGSSVYVLKIGSTSLLEVSSPAMPTLDNVQFTVVPVI